MGQQSQLVGLPLGPGPPAPPAPALTSVSHSLYNNCICDAGAESLAHVLPDMVSLRMLE